MALIQTKRSEVAHERRDSERIEDEYYQDSPGNAETERLLVKIDNLRQAGQKQTVLITSAVLGEGKSTVSSQIAIGSSRNRKAPTLLVDFDLRRPRIHEIFNLKKDIGVAEILTGQLPLRVCIKDTFVKNLKILTSGSLESSPLEVFSAERARRFFEEALKQFDNIIVDSPPVIPVSDPLTLAKVVDHVLFVIKAGHTPKRVAQRALDMIHSIDIQVSGLVLNNMNNVLPAYYDPGYYGYEYYRADIDSNGKQSNKR